MSAVGAEVHATAPPAAAPMLDTALLLVGLLAGWQLLSLLAGAQVLTPPLATLRRLGAAHGRTRLRRPCARDRPARSSWRW